MLVLHQQLRLTSASRQHFLEKQRYRKTILADAAGCRTCKPTHGHDSAVPSHMRQNSSSYLDAISMLHHPHQRGHMRSPPVPPGHRAALVAARQSPILALHAAVCAAYEHTPLRHHVVPVAAAVRAPCRRLRSVSRGVMRKARGGAGGTMTKV